MMTRKPKTCQRAAALVVLLLSMASWSRGAAHPSAGKAIGLAEKNQLVIDLSAARLGVSYARKISPRWLLGGGLSGGPDLLLIFLGGGSHMAGSDILGRHDDGLRRRLYEIFGGEAFARYQPNNWLQVDFGPRASWFLHFVEWDDDPGGGFFVGGYGAVAIGWRYLKVGARISMGVFDCMGPELGAIIFPLMLRGVIPW